MNARLAVKGFIVHDGKLLLMKRAHNDSFKPGIWELPGGRIEHDEDPRKALQREIKE